MSYRSSVLSKTDRALVVLSMDAFGAKEAGYLWGNLARLTHYPHDGGLMIEAKYAGKCRACSRHYKPGSPIELRDGQWVCPPCAHLYDDAARALAKSAALIEATHRGTAGNAARGYKLRAKRRQGRVS